MAKDRVEIGFEVLKVVGLLWLLYYAFNDAHFPDVFWKPAAILIKAGIISFAYGAGRHFADIYKEEWRNYLLIFYCVGILTFISWAGLGTHTEDTDPLFGGGEVVADFIPMPEERDDHAITIFLSLLIPAVYGIHKKRNPH